MGRVPVRIAPTERTRRVMLGAHQLFDRLVRLARRIEKQARDTRERRLAPLVEAMQDERLERFRAGAVPVFRQPLALRVEQKPHYVLHVAVPAMPQIPGARPTAPDAQVNADPPRPCLENSEPLDESSHAARYEPAPLDEPSVTDVARRGPAR